MLPCEHPARDQIQIRCCSLYLSFTIANLKQHVFARGFFASEPSPIRLVAPSRSPRKWSDHHRSADAKAAVSCSTDPGDGWIEKIRLDRRQQLFRKRRTISERPRRRVKNPAIGARLDGIDAGKPTFDRYATRRPAG